MHLAPPPLRRSLPRILLRLAVIVVIVMAVQWLLDWIVIQTETLAPSQQSLMLNGLLTIMLLGYAILIAVPFVPGVEIGVTLLILRGAPIAPLVYLATVLGLMAAFLIGRYISYRWLRQTLLDFRLLRLCEMLDNSHGLTPDERIALFKARLPAWLGPHLMRWRYLVLAGLINLPGSSLIGGGGGILLMAGISRVFMTTATIMTIILAVAPVPIAVWFFDLQLFGSP